jgi:hypothetical protein
VCVFVNTKVCVNVKFKQENECGARDEPHAWVMCWQHELHNRSETARLQKVWSCVHGKRKLGDAVKHSRAQ